MVEFEEDYENQICLCKTPKNLKPIIIRKSNDGYKFFEIYVESPVQPKQLGGKYTSINEAKKAVVKYLSKKQETGSARRQRFTKEYLERKARDAAKTDTESS